jgi:hypothetical protein
MRAERIEAVVPWTDGGLLRSPGVHVSGLLKAMAIDYGLLNRKWVPEDYDLQDITETGESSSEWWDALDEDSKVRMAIGMAWEQWYLPKLIEKYQPGELECEGIFLTIDGESRDLVLADEDCVHEVKTTSKSINTTGHIAEPNPKNWMWLMQCKAYCKARGCGSSISISSISMATTPGPSSRSCTSGALNLLSRRLTKHGLLY